MSFRGGGGGGDGGGGGRWDVGAAWEPGRGGTCTGREVYVREGSEGRSSSKCITSLMQVQVPVPVQVGQLQEILYCMYSSIYFSHQQQHNAHFYYQSLLYHIHHTIFHCERPALYQTSLQKILSSRFMIGKVLKDLNIPVSAHSSLPTIQVRTSKIACFVEKVNGGHKDPVVADLVLVSVMVGKK